MHSKVYKTPTRQRSVAGLRNTRHDRTPVLRKPVAGGFPFSRCIALHLQLGQPDSIVGYPVTIAQDITLIAPNSFSLAFGKFDEVYQIVDRQGFRTIRDNLTAKPFVQFYTTRRVGGGAIQFEAAKFLKF